MEDFDPASLHALVELHSELSKTVILSDGFKDFIVQKTIEAVEEAMSGRNPDNEMLQQEFADRMFMDKAVVQLRVRTMRELVERIDESEVRLKGFAQFVKKHFLGDNAMDRILLGSYEDLIAFREWFYMALNENPGDFAKLVSLGEWDE